MNELSKILHFNHKTLDVMDKVILYRFIRHLFSMGLDIYRATTDGKLHLFEMNYPKCFLAIAIKSLLFQDIHKRKLVTTFMEITQHASQL